MTGQAGLSLVTIGGVLLAGALGVGLRFWISASITTIWPWAVWIVNTLGCLGVGVVYAMPMNLLSASTKIILVVGLLGGLTTFSSYILDAVKMLEEGQWMLALLHFFGSHFLGLAAIFLGIHFTKQWVG